MPFAALGDDEVIQMLASLSMQSNNSARQQQLFAAPRG